MTTPYSMSFTTGALLYHESLVIAELYEALGDWTAVRTTAIAENRLQMRTSNAATRITQEIISRLRLLTKEQLLLLTESSRQEQSYLLWLAICKRYRFIHDFASEVLREKYLRLDMALTYEEYDRFFHDKAEWHPEVARVAPVTRGKQRQFLFKMLRDAGLLDNRSQIITALLTPRLIKAITADDPAYLAIYPAA